MSTGSGSGSGGRSEVERAGGGAAERESPPHPPPQAPLQAPPPAQSPTHAHPELGGGESPDDEARVRVPLAIEDHLSVLVMALLALITLGNVIARYFTNQAFAWTEEISVFLMVVLALVGSSAAVARFRHIRIEFFADSGPERRQRWLVVIGAALTALMFLLLTVLSARVLWDDIEYGETSPAIGVPQWYYSGWVPVLCLAIALRAIGLMWRRWQSLKALNGSRAR